MIGDPRDRTAYAVAIAGLGLALVVVLVGICWLATQHGTSTDLVTHRCALHIHPRCGPWLEFHGSSEGPVPPGLWASLTVLGAVLVGALIPFPFPSWTEGGAGRRAGHGSRRLALFAAPIGILALALVELPDNAAAMHLEELAIASVLLGLLIPSPARGD